MAPLQLALLCLIGVSLTCAQQSNSWKNLICKEPMCTRCLQTRSSNVWCTICECSNRDVCATVRCPRGSVCETRKSVGWFSRTYGVCVPTDRAGTEAPTTTTEATTTLREGACRRDGDCSQDEQCQINNGDATGVCSPVIQRTTVHSRCLEERIAGPCRAGFRKYFYNITSSKCEDFMYGGCGANNNNFDTQDECSQACEVSEQRADDPTDACFEAKDGGICRASFVKYYYNSDSGECEQFAYGGCGGNKNNWESLDQCESQCKGKKK